MARGGGRGGGGGSGRGRGRGAGARKTSGIEKYGQDAADEFLNLNDDEDGGVAEDSWDGEEEEDVMAMPDDDDDEDNAWAEAKDGKAEKQEKGAAAEKGSGRRDEGGTSGWKKADFYGGDDLGDDSDEGSDEELNFEEARKLEERRAQRLGDPEQLFATLIAGGATADAEAKDEPAKASAPSKGASAGAKFESLFAADAEQASVQRDFAQLSESKRKSLLRREAPELLPLLQDHREKLASLRELLPLLAPEALAKMPASGAEYLKAKASLLLSTLTNLSFYLLLRTEGGAVRTHPVVAQLVWLRSLHEKLGPVDAKVQKGLKKALRDVRRNAKEASNGGAEVREAPPTAPQEVAPAPAKRQTLRERLEKLRLVVGSKQEKEPLGGGGEEFQPSGRIAVKDLLRLPKRRGAGADGGPADLEEADPTVGMWMPSSNIGEQLMAVQQTLRQGKEKGKPVSADTEVEARPRRTRDRGQTMEELDRQRKKASGKDEEDLPTEAPMGEDMFQDPMLQEAMSATQRKKAKRAAEEATKEAEVLARQSKPEHVLDGRRKTSKQILANRGLVRVRKREAGNARVANRRKYEKFVKRRKGAVVEMREGAADGATYDGEATGVRTHVKKSMKLS